MRKLIFVFVAIGVGISGGVFADEKRLIGAEIKTQFSGLTITGQTSSGLDFWITFNPDGTVNYKNENNWLDEGKWWVEKDMYCREWDKISDGAKLCYIIKKPDNTKYEVYTADDRYRRDYVIVK